MNNSRPNMKTVALDMLRHGYMPLKVSCGSKNPNCRGWENERLTEDGVLGGAIGADDNVGVLTGSASNGLVDVDLDCPEVAAAASYFLPETHLRWGHPSSPNSHWAYITDPNGQESEKYSAGDFRGIELRADDHHTLWPGSIHPDTREMYEFDEDGEPTQVPPGDLDWMVRRAAAAGLLIKHWSNGERHNIALHLAGMLLCAWDEANVLDFIQGVSERAGDDKSHTADFLTGVKTTAKCQRERKKFTGAPELKKVLPEGIVDKLRDWLQLPAEKTPWQEHRKQALEDDRAVDTNVITLSTVTMRPVVWLIPGYLPLAKVTLLDGEPDKGKSTITFDWAATLSNSEQPKFFGGV
jgi:hypothetical protein